MKKLPKPSKGVLVIAVILWGLAVLMTYLWAKLPREDTFLPVFWGVLFAVGSGAVWAYYFAWMDAYNKRKAKENA